MKKGEWSRMKGVEMIVPKKKQNMDNGKVKEAKKRKEEPKKEEESDKFQHTYFIEQMFEKVTVLSPAAVEDLDKVISELESKQGYFLEHPEGRQTDRG